MNDKALKTEFYAKTAKAPEAPDMARINAQSLRELSAEEVFTFCIGACDTLVDRDLEHFTEETLNEMAEKYIGRTVLLDHDWSAKNQSARIYDSCVEDIPEGKQLVLSAYILRTADSQRMIDRIEAGILREVSVGVAIRDAKCDICGEDYIWKCVHYKGREYGGRLCTVALCGCEDVYEVSFVAVPAQPKAGVKKALEAENQPEGKPETAVPETDARALEIETERYRYE